MAELQQTHDLKALKKSIDLLVLIELSKAGATREEIREVTGGVSNNIIASVNKIFSKGSKANGNK